MLAVSLVLPGALVGAILAILALVWFERRFYITEYLFFIRYPLLLGTVLFLLPVAAPAVAPDSLTNIFVLNAVAVGVASFFAFLASWSIVHTGRLIWVTIPSRCRLALRRHGQDWWDVEEAPPSGNIMGSLWFWLATGLAMPVVLTSVWKVDPPEHRLRALAAGAIGFLAATVVRQVTRYATARREAAHPERRAREPILSRAERLAPEGWRGFVEAVNPYHGLPSSIQRLHERALILFLATLGVYALVGRLARPAAFLADYVPALAYLLILVMMLIWLLGALSFLFDRSRAPGVSLSIIILLLLQSVFPNTHYFPVTPRATAQPGALAAIQTRWERIGSPEAPLVAVAASGGGITASYWTAIVLRGLHARIDGFHQHVGLLSSVSGGGIATMLYADGFTPAGPPGPPAMAQLEERAGTPSLDAVTWGMAYPDLWRGILASRKGTTDRGWALEQRWSRYLADPKATLSGWAEGVREGWRPLQIFNATVQESGERLCLAPADLAPPPVPAGTVVPPRMRRTMEDFTPGGEVRIATAARLSATFPFVSPQARPQNGPWTAATTPLHCADGGYFDNSGLYTALEILGDYLDGPGAPVHPDRIAIVEIRAASPADEIASARRASSRGGLINMVMGPLATLYNARVATQIARGAAEYQLVKGRWKADHAVTVERFIFHLTERLPLSWNLTPRERAFILAHWEEPADPRAFGDREDVARARRHNQDEVERLRKFLLEPERPAEAAPPDPAQRGAPEEVKGRS